jgi:hypothetical protein
LASIARRWFLLVLRAYMPSAEMVDQTWQPAASGVVNQQLTAPDVLSHSQSHFSGLILES